MVDRLHVLFQARGRDPIGRQDRAAEQSGGVSPPPSSFTGKMNASEPGVCPGMAMGVMVVPPSVTGCPSASTRSRFGPRGALAGWFAGGLGGLIRSQSAAAEPTFAP